MRSWQYFIFIFIAPFALLAQTTHDFGHAERSYLPASYLKVLVWNIHGGLHEDFIEDYQELANESHLVLMQEADLSPQLEADLLKSDFTYTHARSFVSPISGANKGVATGSVSKATSTRALRSPVSELGFTTPKAVLLQTFKLSNRQQQLLVVNVHAINFVTNDMFRAHIDQIAKAMAAHKGPIIAAGDFNTWNESRLSSLDKAMDQLGLNRVAFGQGRSSFPDLGRWFGVRTGGAFDQVYVRGLTTRFKEVHAGIKSSDHKPLELHFSVQ